MLHPVRVLLVALTWAASLILTLPSKAQSEVDLALVIAVDISYSMDTDEQELQWQGFAAAFRASDVHEAIGKGMLGRTAVVRRSLQGLWPRAEYPGRQCLRGYRGDRCTLRPISPAENTVTATRKSLRWRLPSNKLKPA
jgi:hypothetical protein